MDYSKIPGMVEETNQKAKLRNVAVGMVYIFILLGLLIGFADLDDETVVSVSTYDRSTEYFEADESEEIAVSVDNRAGFRTHVALESPDGDLLLSEGVEDDAFYTVDAEEAGEYTLRVDPADSDPSTVSRVSVEVLDD